MLQKAKSILVFLVVINILGIGSLIGYAYDFSMDMDYGSSYMPASSGVRYSPSSVLNFASSVPTIFVHQGVDFYESTVRLSWPAGIKEAIYYEVKVDGEESVLTALVYIDIETSVGNHSVRVCGVNELEERSQWGVTDFTVYPVPPTTDEVSLEIKEKDSNTAEVFIDLSEQYDPDKYGDQEIESVEIIWYWQNSTGLLEEHGNMVVLPSQLNGTEAVLEVSRLEEETGDGQVIFGLRVNVNGFSTTPLKFAQAIESTNTNPDSSEILEVKPLLVEYQDPNSQGKGGGGGGCFISINNPWDELYGK
jgi:hypothetical protein